jgi:hypothetical protein
LAVSSLWSATASDPKRTDDGENDSDVPIAEAEQYYIALRDAGVDAVMYPREGHGARETRHVIDVIDRSIAWYRKHFGTTSSTDAARK